MFPILYISTLAVIAAICFILGFHVLYRDRSSRINRLFFINSMLLNAVIAFTVFIQFSPDAETAGFFQSMYNIVLIIFLLESLYFNLVFTGRSLNRISKVILLASTSVVFIIFIFRGDDLLLLTKENGVWVYELMNNRFWFLLYSPLLFLILLIMVSTLYRYSRGASSNKEKKQAGVMLAFILTSCSAGFLVLMIMPLFDRFRIPLLTPYFFAVYLYGVFYAMTKYRFMVFNIKDIAQDVLSHIQDAVIILAPDKRIMEMNNSASILLGAGSAGLKGTLFTDVVYERDALDVALDSVRHSRVSLKQRVTYKVNPEAVVTDSDVSAVCDRFGDLSAILIISRENRGVNHFKNYFKLTAREMEIILNTISGVTNVEMAKNLDITKRTVETHQCNIYNKLGINNKIELLNITSDFGIKPL
jgi:DNA-binding NarL/FixJ family response regulator